MKICILSAWLILIEIMSANAQSLGRVGSDFDVNAETTAGTVLMGGGADVDAAFKWMINKSGGGDFVVIRASGTNAYNSYIFSLGSANSVETFLISSRTLANDSSIVQAVRKAEALFFAGGDQNNYIKYYKDTALGSVLDYLANVKHIPFGGTSAGMAIQGYVYYDGVTNVVSEEVLQNPYRSGTGIHYNDFLHNPFLQKTICDTHFNTKGGTTSNGITGRQGRLMTFLSRMITDSAMTDVKGIACDEKTAVCIDQNGIAMVAGLGKAYFLRQWCAAPEICSPGQPLTWTNGVKVYVIAGPGSYSAVPSSGKSADLKDWTTVKGGAYEFWTVNSGVLTVGQLIGTPAVCGPSAISNSDEENAIRIYPNPAADRITILSDKPFSDSSVKLYNSLGQMVQRKSNLNGNRVNVDLSALSCGTYTLEIEQTDNILRRKIIKQ
jgi:cyanophycinase-like exopeptidase